MIDGKHDDVHLGGYPAVPLAMAHRRAAENRTVIAEDRDPLAEKHQSRRPIFAKQYRKPMMRSDHTGGITGVLFRGCRHCVPISLLEFRK